MKKHEDNLSSMLVRWWWAIVQNKRRLYTWNHMSMYSMLWNRQQSTCLLFNVKPCAHMRQRGQHQSINKGVQILIHQILQQQVPQTGKIRRTRLLQTWDSWSASFADCHCIYPPKSSASWYMRYSFWVWVFLHQGLICHRTWAHYKRKTA